MLQANPDDADRAKSRSDRPKTLIGIGTRRSTTNFREKVHQYREWIDDAYTEADRDESIAKWRRVFSAMISPEARSTERATTVSSVVLTESRLPSTDIVEAVTRFGGRSSATASTQSAARVAGRHGGPPNLAPTSPFKFTPGMYATRNGNRVGRFRVRRGVVPRARELLFEAVTATGFPFPANDYDVRWRVVNTDREAAQARGLRGGFYKSDRPGARWESTSYHGAHWVEAFVIRKRDKVCVGQSDRFFVVIA